MSISRASLYGYFHVDRSSLLALEALEAVEDTKKDVESQESRDMSDLNKDRSFLGYFVREHLIASFGIREGTVDDMRCLD